MCNELCLLRFIFGSFSLHVHSGYAFALPLDVCTMALVVRHQVLDSYKFTVMWLWLFIVISQQKATGKKLKREKKQTRDII